MKFGELIEQAITCIQTFNPVIKTIDSHADDFLANFKDPYEKVFVKQVFYGCIRYQDFLKLFNKVFYELNSHQLNRNDRTLYHIFAYMTFLRLDELSIQDYRRLINSQEATKMHVFLQFAFNADLLREHMREPWMTIYDFSYIDEKIIGSIEKNLPAVSDILKSVERRATGKVSTALSITSSQHDAHGETQTAQLTEANLSMQESRLSHHGAGSEKDVLSDNGEIEKKKVTEFKPFNLTKAKPKLIPAPEAIKREVKARPVPKNLNKKTLADIENDKKERRQATIKAIKGEYEGNPQKRFQLQTEARPTIAKFDSAKKRAEAEFKKELKFEGIKAKPAPDFDSREANVKLNVAALKREKHLIDKEEKEMEQRVKEMAMGLKDDSEFYRWKREMDQKDDIERMEHIQKKKIEMELAREEAILARERKEKENQQLVNKMRIESDVRKDEIEKNIEDEISRKKDVIAYVHANRDAASQQMEAKRVENKQIRDEVHKEIQEALKKKQDEEAIELAKKIELIRQIRELEKIPIQRTKGFDPTEASGLGLMEEMSIAELRERLEFNKRKLQQEVDFKRETNLTKKEQEAAKLMEDAKKIEEARKKRKVENDARRLQRKTDAEVLAEKTRIVREQGLHEAYEKINKKKQDKAAEDERLAKGLKEIKLQRQYLNANAAMVEEKAWKELEAGKERQLRDQQNERLIDQCKVNEIMVKDQTVRADNAKTLVMQKLVADQEYKNRLNTRKKENEVLHKNTLQYKASMHEKQMAFRDKLGENARKRNPFVAKINEQSLHNAKLHKTRMDAAKMQNMNSLEYAALQEHLMDEEGEDYGAELNNDGLGGFDETGAMDDISAKLENE